MQFVYFTKLLKEMTLQQTAEFLRSVGLSGPDLAVRDGFPVNPRNVTTALGEAKKIFADHGLSIPMVTASTNLIDATSSEARRIFESCGQNQVQAVKIGYFRFTGNFERDLAHAKNALSGFAKIAEQTGVKTCYHTHSGNYIGSNCAGMRMLLEDLDPHHIGAFVDTGHQTIGGAPFRMALDMVAPWLSLIAIKDVAWEKSKDGWKHHVVPAGTGIADWREIARALQERGYDGIISLHGEYEADDADHRLQLAKQELAFLKEKLKAKK